MGSCRYDPNLGQRVLVRSDDGEPCPERHCVVCGRGHCDDTNPQTCAECVGLVRENLTEIMRLYEELPRQARDGGADGRLLAGAPIPGAEAMVLLAPGSDARARAWARERGDQREAEGRKRGYDGDYSHAQDEVDSDPMPPLLVLATWEDDVRSFLGHPAGPRATMWRCADYLGQHLTLMAQRHPAFDEYARDLARCRARLEDVLGEGERDERGAPCQKCGTLLVRRCHPRHGLVDEWECPRCRTSYTAAEYWKAVEQDYQDNAEALHAEAIQRRTGVAIGTIRVWVSRGKVRTRGKDERGRVLYDVADVEEHAEGDVA
jgi:hypothetical protein